MWQVMTEHFWKNYKKEILKVGIDPILSKHKNSYPVNTIKIQIILTRRK